jgi:hypothetical protein
MGKGVSELVLALHPGPKVEETYAGSKFRSARSAWRFEGWIGIELTAPPVGEWVQPTAFRQERSGCPHFWNVKVV